MNKTDKIREFAKRTPVFDTSSVSRLIGDADYAYLLLNKLLKKGEVKRITNGFYTIHDDPSLFVYCVKPAYLGLQDALSFHNLWQQETIPVIVTARKTRTGKRSVLGNEVLVRRISPKHFFGAEHVRQGELLLPVSDLEKTFIDLVYFREIRKELSDGFKGKMDKKKLNKYLKGYDKKFSQSVINMLG